MRKKLLIAAALLLVIIMGSWYIVQRRAQHTGPEYVVALGDSVTAGDGLPLAGNDPQAATCARSDQAYPNVIAQRLHSKLRTFACSGAQVTAGLLQSQTANGTTLLPQLAAAKQYIRGNDVVLTVGANDVNWANMLTRCAQTDCTTGAELAAYQARLVQLQGNLDDALGQIQAAQPHRIIVNTYYALVRNSDTCFAASGITPVKIAWANQREAKLNDLLATVAKQHGAAVIKIDFSGHLLCDQNPWIQSLFEAAPLHPNQTGQQRIARQDLEMLQ